MRPALLLAGANVAGACLLSVTAGRHALHQQWTPAAGAALITALLVAAAVREEEHADQDHAMRAASAEVARITRNCAASAAGDELAILQHAVDTACCLTGLRTEGRDHDRACRREDRAA